MLESLITQLQKIAETLKLPASYSLIVFADIFLLHCSQIKDNIFLLKLSGEFITSRLPSLLVSLSPHRPSCVWRSISAGLSGLEFICWDNIVTTVFFYNAILLSSYCLRKTKFCSVSTQRVSSFVSYFIPHLCQALLVMLCLIFWGVVLQSLDLFLKNFLSQFLSSPHLIRYDSFYCSMRWQVPRWGLTGLFRWHPGTWQRGRSEQPLAFVSLWSLGLLAGWLVSSLHGGSRALLLHSPGGFMLQWRPGRQRLLCPWPTKCVSDRLSLSLSRCLLRSLSLSFSAMHPILPCYLSHFDSFLLLLSSPIHAVNRLHFLLWLFHMVFNVFYILYFKWFINQLNCNIS